MMNDLRHYLNLMDDDIVPEILRRYNIHDRKVVLSSKELYDEISLKYPELIDKITFPRKDDTYKKESNQNISDTDCDLNQSISIDINNYTDKPIKLVINIYPSKPPEVVNETTEDDLFEEEDILIERNIDEEEAYLEY